MPQLRERVTAYIPLTLELVEGDFWEEIRPWIERQLEERLGQGVSGVTFEGPIYQGSFILDGVGELAPAHYQYWAMGERNA